MKIDQESWLEVEPYYQQQAFWPDSGKHIMAQSCQDYVIVYQAYRPSIGNFAAKQHYFGGDFSYSRMSWIKPNFLWMMYRSGWGTKEGQETTLAIFLKPEYFEYLLQNAFPSTNVFGLAQQEWKEKIAATDVRLQWDPDHNPYGEKLDRKAIQLGLRNNYLAPFKGDGIVRIEDISPYVAEQRKFVEAGDLTKLLTPKERVFSVSKEIQNNLWM